jgi:hypothetical protein
MNSRYRFTGFFAGAVFQKEPCRMCDQQQTKNRTRKIVSRDFAGERHVTVAIFRGKA